MGSAGRRTDPAGERSLFGNDVAFLLGHQEGERAVADGRVEGPDGAVGQDDVGATGVEAVEAAPTRVGAVDDAHTAGGGLGAVKQRADEPVLAAEGVAPPGA